MRRRLLPEFTYRQGWWLTGAGLIALVTARVVATVSLREATNRISPQVPAH